MPIKLTVWLSAACEKGHVFFCDSDEVEVGRSPGVDVQLPVSFVSGHQFTLVAEGDAFLLSDAGSTNGTALNGKRLAPYAYVPVWNGDLIGVGELLIQIEIVPTLPDGSATTSEDPVRGMVREVLRARGEASEATLELADAVGTRWSVEDMGATLRVGCDEDAQLRLPEGTLSAGRSFFLERRPGAIALRSSQALWLDGERLGVEPQALGAAHEIGDGAGGASLRFRDPLRVYLDELARLPEDRRHGAAEHVHLSTQQIDTTGYGEIEGAPPDFGPPDRPPVPAQPRLRHESIEVSLRERGRWGAFELWTIVLTLLVALGGVIVVYFVLRLAIF